MFPFCCLSSRFFFSFLFCYSLSLSLSLSLSFYSYSIILHFIPTHSSSPSCPFPSIPPHTITSSPSPTPSLDLLPTLLTYPFSYQLTTSLPYLEVSRDVTLTLTVTHIQPTPNITTDHHKTRKTCRQSPELVNNTNSAYKYHHHHYHHHITTTYANCKNCNGDFFSFSSLQPPTSVNTTINSGFYCHHHYYYDHQ